MAERAAGEVGTGTLGVGGAVVVATSPGATRVVAGLPLVARAVLALRAAGFPDVVVLGSEAAEGARRRLARRGIVVRWLRRAAEAQTVRWPDLVLVVPADTLFDEAVFAPLLAAATPGPLRSPGGGEPRAAVCPGGRVAPLLAAIEAGAGSWAEALRQADAPTRAVDGLAPGLLVPLGAARPPAVAATMLLDHLAGRTRAGDSYMAALLDRRLSRPVTRVCLGLPVTPSQITLASLVFGLVGAAGLASVSYWGRLGGVLALIVSIVLDCVDGEVARARFEQSAAGARLDVIGDYVVNLSAFVGLGVGLAREGFPPAGVWAVVVLLGGVAAAMASMHALFVRPALERGGDLHWAGDAESLHGTPAAAVLEKVASRDYTYLLLVCAVAGHLEWFLYAAALGSWVFVAGLLAYRARAGAASRRGVASR